MARFITCNEYAVNTPVVLNFDLVRSIRIVEGETEICFTGGRTVWVTDSLDEIRDALIKALTVVLPL